MAFAAKYRGKCADCGEWFPEGTMIHYNDDDEIVHDDCDDGDIAELEETGTPCSDCYLVHKGECL